MKVRMIDRRAALFAVVCLVLATSPARAAGTLRRVLRILGMSAAPGQMKGSDTEAGPGQIWIADVRAGSRRALTPDGGYRWPVFEIGDKSVIALRASKLIRIWVQSGAHEELREAAGVEKLVGFDPTQPDEVLVVRNDASVPLALLSLTTGKLTALPLDRADKEQNQALSSARGETRIYGERRLFLRTESRAALEGKREWQNVYLQEGSTAPQAVSLCKDVTCHQPSLSLDGTRVAYVQADPGG